jgi:hypothetical protein
MTAKMVTTYATSSSEHSDPLTAFNATMADESITNTGLEEYTPIQVVCAVSMVVGIYHVSVYTFQIGFFF